MNIVMVTNTYGPAAGEVAQSVARLTAEYRRRGHRVLVVTPENERVPGGDDIIQVSLLRKFNDSDFAVGAPLSSAESNAIAEFRPDIVHAHHPYLLGAAALRIAAKHDVPLVFTHHTMYEHDPGHIPGRFPALRRFAAELATGYANLADRVIAPSRSTAAMLQSRGVNTPIEIIPNGIDIERFRHGNGSKLRNKLGIPPEAFVVGHVGRSTPDKNLEFLTSCLARVLRERPEVHVLVVGSGPLQAEMKHRLEGRGGAARVHFCETLYDEELADAYSAMNLFAFASKTETQGIALLEAMSAGVPVVAIDAPGVREIVRDGINGRLLTHESRRDFVAAIAHAAEQSEPERSRWSDGARNTVAEFSADACADRIFDVYTNVVADAPGSKETESSAWEATRRRIEAEWELWSSRAHAAGMTFADIQHPARYPVLRQLFRWWRRFRRWFSRREWSVRLLNLPVSEGAADEPGVILLQIDGLSRNELDRALHRGRLPFLKRLIEHEYYSVRTMYSGQPATTPAVLGELFYGVPRAVPAFGFRDHRTGRVVEMFHPGIASRVQHELSQKGEGLLSEGAAYCDIYSGGAAESSFCPATTGWRNLEDAALWRQTALFLMNVMSLVRIAGLSIVELFVAIGDCVRGIVGGTEVWREIAYIPRRVIVNVVLREFVGISAEVDATRGLRAIHANLLGYDENAHRRGPDALFAHYALRGIDRTIRRIWNAAHASRRRNYHVWIMADHGQERTVPYPHEYSEEVADAVARVHRDWTATTEPAPARNSAGSRSNPGMELQRSNWLRRHWNFGDDEEHPVAESRPTTVAVGPLGYIYWPDELPDSEIDPIAQRLVKEARIPLVLAQCEGSVWGWTNKGRFRIPEEAHEILAPGHPFPEDTARDLAKLCDHPDAGRFVISGWRNDGPPLTFLPEHGSHAGPGPRETSGFALLPPDAPLPRAGSDTFRPLTLRKMALSVLHQGTLGHRERYPAHAENFLRIATYNVHSCIGLDGKLSPVRIARVLAMAGADVIALQELDVGRGRSGFTDQVERITRALEMEFHFHPSFEIEKEQFGTAILSRLPMKLVRTGILPSLGTRREPRGAIQVEVDVDGVPVQIVNTHLGLSAAERKLQIEELLGPQWLGSPACGETAVLCGDLNLLPRSRSYRTLAGRLRDVQTALDQHSPRRTWFGPFPLTRIDHLFVGKRLRVSRVEVPRTRLSKIASDHLPLIVDLEVLPANDEQADDSDAHPHDARTNDDAPHLSSRTTH